MNKKAVLSLSGGMDSATLALHLLGNNYDVTCISFDYGQKHKIELEKAAEFIQYIQENGYEKRIRHHIIKLDGLSDLLTSSLVSGGTEVPEGHYKESSMKSTVVPNRNKIFSSIIQAAALSIAKEHGCRVDIAMGIHAGDHDIYPDCRQEFRDADYNAFLLGNWEAEQVDIYTPYLNNNKEDILRDGKGWSIVLGLDFNELYRRTMTSYKPIMIQGAWIEPIQRYGEMWYSDYKSSSSVERIEAFIAIGVDDPAPYADETGPVSFNVARSHVINLLENKN